MGRDGLGEFEHLVLLAVLSLGRDAYGVAIIRELQRRAGRRVTRAALYVALRRLEEKGWLRSELGEPTAERGGRAKRYFRVTPAALARLRRTRDVLADFWAAIPGLQAK
jgi:DNA-binding PadR family transcriptional regulator